MPSNSGCRSAGGFSHTPAFTSTPLPHGGAFILASDPEGDAPSSASGMPPGDMRKIMAGGLSMRS